MKFLPVMAAAALATQSAFAALPKATEIYPKMGLGYNIGNTMEVPIASGCTDMTCWGNPYPTQEFIDSVKAAGFNTVRIPTAWYSHSNAISKDSSMADLVAGGDEYAISAGWMDSVKAVVDMCIKNEMYVILNIHFDSGWLEQQIGTSVNETVNARQAAFWKQIATKFASYDEHLLFASANEPGMNQAGSNNGETFKTNDAYMKTLKTYHETMINTVRATGGNNATRTIIVQDMNTDPTMLSQLKENFPSDPTNGGTDYMMGEFHFYPYQFSLMRTDDSWGNAFYYWGEDNYSKTDSVHNAIYSKSANANVVNQFGTPAWTDSIFAAIRTTFGTMPMIIGEFGAEKRLELVGENLRLHLQSRATWYGKVAELSKKNNFVPVIWDTGAEDGYNMTVIRRQEGAKGIFDYEVLNAMRKAYGLDTIAGNSIDSLVKESTSTEDKCLKVTYMSKQSDSSEVGTLRIAVGGKDWSQYVGISFETNINLTNSPLTGESYGWMSLSAFAMSTNNWVWTDYNFDEEEVKTTGWTKHTISFDAKGLDFTKTNDLGVAGSIKEVQAFGINVYGTQLKGVILFDNFLLLKADGTVDTLDNMNKRLPQLEGIASGKLEPRATATAGIQTASAAKALSGLHFFAENGNIHAGFNASKSGKAVVRLVGLNGKVLASETVSAVKGANSVQLSTKYRGAAVLQMVQGASKATKMISIK